jgi:hypothetical protein
MWFLCILSGDVLCILRGEECIGEQDEAMGEIQVIGFSDEGEQ